MPGRKKILTLDDRRPGKVTCYEPKSINSIKKKADPFFIFAAHE
jgi:hypothetical protein